MNPWGQQKPQADGQRETMPRDQQKALADLCGFGRLEKYPEGYAANALHLPELAHSPAVIDQLVRAGYAGRETAPAKGVYATAPGRDCQNAIAAARLGEVAQ